MSARMFRAEEPKLDVDVVAGAEAAYLRPMEDVLGRF